MTARPRARPNVKKAGLREHLPLAPQREARFRWRGTGVTRVEGLTDSVFAFAVTLLVVALEVPRTYEGLLDVMRAFPGFILCFALLMLFWNAHYRYHRRYGLEDVPTRLLTMAIIVLVLFFVYPLKFLFTLLTVQLFSLEMHNAPYLESREQLRTLYVLYGAGFAGVWGLYTAMYAYALRLRERLQLDAAEILYTKTSLGENLIYVGVCILSILLALTTSTEWLPGVIYFLLGPLQAFNGWWFGRRIRALPAV
jgi:uncharacterized membrane protein